MDLKSAKLFSNNQIYYCIVKKELQTDKLDKMFAAEATEKIL